MRKKILKTIVFLVLAMFILYPGAKKLLAQLANPPDAVGPELAFFDQGGQEGVNSRVLVPNNFHGAVQVINLVGLANTPYNPAPGTDVTLRLAGITHTTTIGDMTNYAQKLNNFDGFPVGTIVIVGNEMNNLSGTEWASDPSGAQKNNATALAQAGREYAALFKAFSGAIDHNKYRVAPAPPDLYNGDYDPTPWIAGFKSAGVCGSIDVLIANVFNVPSRVGTGNLDTYKYWENTLGCGKSVVRFGGWGSDPSLSVDAQVQFLNNTPLPAGISAATTLIVDNCNGHQGNVTKSGWMYYIRGKVFRADGTEVDPKTCAGEGTPFKLDYISCDKTTFPEFHSLRPYPTSACDQQVDQSVYMCGNDLVVKETLSFVPGQAYKCDPLPDGTGQKCYFFVHSNSNISLGLSAADLPILGNTELVPNSTNGGASGLDFNTRVNEYASWYLNGIPYRAEEKPQLINGQPVTVANESIHEIEDLGGPIKRLLPRDIQTGERNDERDRINNNLGPGQAGETRTARHNQIVACNNVNDPQACYTDSNNPLRITDVPSTPDLKAFPYIPFSSTEDRVGEAKSSLEAGFPDFDCNTAVPPADPNTFGINCAHFTPSIENRNLYFAHTEEVKELGTILQSTFKSYGINDAGSAPLAQFNQENNTKYCELVESRHNPGDKLYGDLARDGTQPINGKLNYTANVICEFKNPDPVAVAACQAACPAQASPQCQIDCGTPNQQCKQEIFVPFKVQVSMPNANEIYTKLVAGSQSIFKRIFPKTGPGTPVDEIKDIPGRTNANYSSINTGVTNGSLDSATTLAGNPGEGRPGASAQIFFPHLGSIYDYFLQGIQIALRPFKNGLPSGAATPPPACQINCNQAANLPAQWAFLERYKPAFVSAANRLYGSGKSYASECFNDVVSRAAGRGINPMFALTAWLHESDASNYEAAGCNVADFGIVGGGVAPADFNGQINEFLNLPGAYKQGYPQCYNQPVPTTLADYAGQIDMLAFTFIYLNGPRDCVPVNSFYYDDFVKEWSWTVPECTKTINTKLLFTITSPQDMSCPRP